MSPFEIPHEVVLHIVQWLDLEDICSWLLTAKRFYRSLISELYFKAVFLDERNGWPSHLVRSGLLNRTTAFKEIIKRTPLIHINEPNVDTRMVPGLTRQYQKEQLEVDEMRTWKRVWQSHPVYTSLLHIVCQYCDVELVKATLDKGVCTSIVDGKWNSPLHVAAGTDNVLVMKLLLDAGADINIYSGENRNEDTPLHVAISYDCTSAVELLTEKGADLKSISLANPSYPSYPLDRAAGREALMILNRLLKFGNYDEASLTHALERAMPTNTESGIALLRAGAIPSTKALYTACMNDCGPAIRILVNAGADVDHVDEYGQTALHLVNTREAALIILDKAPHLIHSRDNDGCTPLDCVRNYIQENIGFGGEEATYIRLRHMPLKALLQSRMRWDHSHWGPPK